MAGSPQKNHVSHNNSKQAPVLRLDMEEFALDDLSDDVDTDDDDGSEVGGSSSALRTLEPANRDSKIRSGKKMLKKFQQRRQASTPDELNTEAELRSYERSENFVPVVKRALAFKTSASPALRSATHTNHAHPHGQHNAVTHKPSGNTAPISREPTGINKASILAGGTTTLTKTRLEERIEKALTARLYLLRQNGPNAFVVCSDILYKKFRVILGPQTCSCGRFQCTHLLFVMLRVLRVETSDPLLRRDVLKDFEVENLLTRAEERYKVTRGHLREERPANETDDACPICLLKLTNGQPLTRCTRGCGNRLHEKCMEIWALERKRLTEKIICPLCRTDWDSKISELNERLPAARSNILVELLEGDSSPSTRLPVTEPLSPTNALIAKNWSQLFEANLVQCVFSKNWAAREAALIVVEQKLVHLPQTIDSGFVLEIVVGMLKQVVVDPVYKVYAACLSLFRCLYTAFIESRQSAIGMKHFQAAIRPVLEDIMTRCSDNNRRIVTRSVDEILTMSRDVRYGVACLAPVALAHPPQAMTAAWRWYLGRLELLSVALNEHPQAIREPLGDYEKSISDFMAVCFEFPHLSVRQVALQLLSTSCDLAGDSAAGICFIRSFVNSLKPLVRRSLDKRIIAASNAAIQYEQHNHHSHPVPTTQTDPHQNKTCAEIVAEEELASGKVATTLEIPNVTIPEETMLESSSPTKLSLKPRPLSDCFARFPVSPLKGTPAEGLWRRGPLLGTGAFSSCFAALDLTDGKLMAVKQINFCRSTTADEEEVIQEITREIDILKNLSHPNIVQYLSCEWNEGHLNIFLEHASGGSIASLISKYGALPEPVVRSYTLQLLKGLAYLHDAGIIHRDIKGANVLLDGHGQVKLADFGSSKRMAKLQTLTGEIRSARGTPAFLAPEAIRGEKYGRRGDVWSLGCVCLEMLTGRPPWLESVTTEKGLCSAEVNNPFAVMFRIASATGPPPLPTGISPDAQDFILHCLQIRPDDRWTTEQLLTHPFVNPRRVTL